MEIVHLLPKIRKFMILDSQMVIFVGKSAKTAIKT